MLATEWKDDCVFVCSNLCPAFIQQQSSTTSSSAVDGLRFCVVWIVSAAKRIDVIAISSSTLTGLKCFTKKCNVHKRSNFNTILSDVGSCRAEAYRCLLLFPYFYYKKSTGERVGMTGKYAFVYCANVNNVFVKSCKLWLPLPNFPFNEPKQQFYEVQYM